MTRRESGGGKCWYPPLCECVIIRNWSELPLHRCAITAAVIVLTCVCACISWLCRKVLVLGRQTAFSWRKTTVCKITRAQLSRLVLFVWITQFISDIKVLIGSQNLVWWPRIMPYYRVCLPHAAWVLITLCFFTLNCLFLYRIKDGLWPMHILPTPQQLTKTVCCTLMVLLLGYGRKQTTQSTRFVFDLQILNGTESNFVLLTCAWV